MFEELPFIFGFMIFSIIISYLLIKYTSGPFLKIVQALAIAGIVFHELSHLLMCLVCHAPIDKITLIKKVKPDKGEESRYFGVVNVPEDSISFLQAFLIGFAPLFLSFWFFFFLLDFLISNQVTPLIFFLCFFTMISLVLSAAPSFADLKIIPRAFSIDTNNSFYQIILVCLSILITWIIIVSYNIQAAHEIFIYLIIAGFYFLLKYGIKLTMYIIGLINQNWFESYKQPKKIKFKSLTRRHYKPKKYE